MTSSSLCALACGSAGASDRRCASVLRREAPHVSGREIEAPRGFREPACTEVTDTLRCRISSNRTGVGVASAKSGAARRPDAEPAVSCPASGAAAHDVGRPRRSRIRTSGVLALGRSAIAGPHDPGRHRGDIEDDRGNADGEHGLVVALGDRDPRVDRHANAVEQPPHRRCRAFWLVVGCVRLRLVFLEQPYAAAQQHTQHHNDTRDLRHLATVLRRLIGGRARNNSHAAPSAHVPLGLQRCTEIAVPDWNAAFRGTP